MKKKKFWSILKIFLNNVAKLQHINNQLNQYKNDQKQDMIVYS
jgi:hypothetical protein